MADLKFVIDVEDSDVVRTLKNHEKLEKEIMSLQKQYGLLRQAQSQGMISQAAYAKGIAQIDGKIGHLTTTLNSGASAINKHADYVAQAKNKMSRFGMVSQQVGYQVGDFFVQVQSGQNVMVAFAQQGTQLAGLLPGVTGAVVGISLSLVGMIYQMNRARDSAEDLAKAFGKVKDAIGELSGVEASLKVALELPVDEASKKLVAYLQNLKNVKTEAAKTEFSTALAPTFSGYAEEAAGLNKKLTERINLAGYDGGLALSGKERKDAEERLALVVKLNNQFIALKNGPIDGMAERLIDFRKTLQDNNELSVGTQKIFDSLLETTGMRAEYESKLVEQNKKQQQQAQQQIDLENKFQKEAEDRAATALKNYLKGEEDKQSLAQKTLQQQIDLDNRLKKEAADRAADYVKQWTEANRKVTMLLGGSAAQAMDKYGSRYTTSSKKVAFGDDRDKTPPKDKTLSGTTLDIIEAEAKARMAALLLGDEELALYERQLDIRQALGDYSAQYSDATVRAAAERIEAMQREEDALNRIRQRNEDLAQTIAQTMGDGLMSIVDGTKSVEQAFKDMARLIIVELYKVLVVEQMVLAIKNAIRASGYLPFENGSAFSGGNVVPFASGGVVGSPTTFPMSGGRTGLMGEAGPEAIMPLQRGANGKLGVAVNGGESGTTVNQVINISTGVQQTVRNEIRSMMPQIAEASKAAVVDSKRRGGSYGGSFR
jgi:hypothetical protein